MISITLGRLALYVVSQERSSLLNVYYLAFRACHVCQMTLDAVMSQRASSSSILRFISDIPFSMLAHLGNPVTERLQQCGFAHRTSIQQSFKFTQHVLNRFELPYALTTYTAKKG